MLLVFVPEGRALVHLIAHSRSMTGRSPAEDTELQAARADHIEQVAGAVVSAADQIASAESLLGSGALDRSAYETLTAKALA